MADRIQYDKLIRDKIPEIIEEAGKEFETRKLDDEEYHEKLREKLQEEVDEYLESDDVEELADILEVIRALADVEDIDMQKLENLRSEKAKERGAFNKQILLVEAEE